MGISKAMEASLEVVFQKHVVLMLKQCIGMFDYVVFETLIVDELCRTILKWVSRATIFLIGNLDPTIRDDIKTT